MDRRIRDNCDADTARTKAKLIGELLHTFLYDHQIYFDKREVGHPAWGGNDITRLCVDADAGDADAKEEVIKLQSYLMTEGVEADDVVAVISEHRRCDIGIAGQRTKRAMNRPEPAPAKQAPAKSNLKARQVANVVPVAEQESSGPAGVHTGQGAGTVNI